jgi:hypothetical protein
MASLLHALMIDSFYILTAQLYKNTLIVPINICHPLYPVGKPLLAAGRRINKPESCVKKVLQ